MSGQTVRSISAPSTDGGSSLGAGEQETTAALLEGALATSQESGRRRLTFEARGSGTATRGPLVRAEPLFVSATPLGIMPLLREHDVALSGAHAVVVGRSNTVGKPLAQLLLQANATVTTCHSRTRGLAEHVG